MDACPGRQDRREGRTGSQRSRPRGGLDTPGNYTQTHAATPKGKEAAHVTSQAQPTPFIPGSSIRGALRANLSRLWRQAGHSVWAPNDAAHPAPSASDPLLPLFGSISGDAHLLVSDAYPFGAAPQVYIQELHAEDEFTQSTYESAKFNRPCIVSGTFGFRIAIKERLSHPPGDDATSAGGLDPAGAATAKQVVAMIDALGKARQLPLGGGIWRGHGWVDIALQPESDDDAADCTPHPATASHHERESIA